MVAAGAAAWGLPTANAGTDTVADAATDSGVARARAQRPLIDAATVVRAAVEGGSGDGLSSIVIEDAGVAVFWKGGQAALPAGVAAAVRDATRIAPVRVADAAYSRTDLLAASATLEDRLTGNPRVHGIAAKPDGSGVVVDLEPAAPGTAQTLSSLPADAGVPVTVDETPRMRPTSRLDDRSPWSGGAKVLINGAACTSGFGTNSPQGPTMIIAAHCGNTGDRLTDAQGETIGTIGGVDKDLDITIVPTNAISNKIYVGGRDSGEQRTVVGAGAPFVGELLCQSGKSSAEATGAPVCNLRVEFEDTDATRLWEARQLDGQIGARPGDSGGPVYSDRGDGTVIARGTLTRSAGSNIGFAGFEKYEQKFGVSIPGSQLPATGTVSLKSHLNGRCLDVPNAEPVDRARVQMWDCNNTVAQKWTVGLDGTVRAMGKCLDVDSGTAANGTAIQLWSCNGSPAQRFTLTAAGDLVSSLNAGKCMDIVNVNQNNGAKLHLWDCVGAAHQRWSRA
jgi:hypothetical protein